MQQIAGFLANEKISLEIKRMNSRKGEKVADVSNNRAVKWDSIPATIMCERTPAFHARLVNTNKISDIRLVLPSKKG